MKAEVFDFHKVLAEEEQKLHNEATELWISQLISESNYAYRQTLITEKILSEI